MKITIIIAVFLLVLLFLSIKIILFSSQPAPIAVRAKVYKVDTARILNEKRSEEENALLKAQKLEEEKKIKDFYDKLFLLKGIKLQRGKEFKQNYKIYKTALFFLKKKNLGAARRRLEHITSFLEERYLPDLLLKMRAYFLLSDIAQKQGDNNASSKYMEKFMYVYRKLVSNKEYLKIKNRLEMRQFLAVTLSGIDKNEKKQN